LNTTNNLLFQNYPNPAKNIFDIEYIVADSSVSSFIIIYNVLGEKVMSIALTEKGKSKITINSSAFSSGVYLYSLIVENKRIATKKMIILH
jgi:hypothetical protein